MQISFELCISDNEQPLPGCCFFFLFIFNFCFSWCAVHCTRCTTYVIIISIFLSLDFASNSVSGSVSHFVRVYWAFQVFEFLDRARFHMVSLGLKSSLKLSNCHNAFVEIEWNIDRIRSSIVVSAARSSMLFGAWWFLWLKMVGWKLLNAITITPRNKLLLIYWTCSIAQIRKYQSSRIICGSIAICFANL